MFQYRCLPWISIMLPAFQINVFESRACMCVMCPCTCVCVFVCVRGCVHTCLSACVCVRVFMLV